MSKRQKKKRQYRKQTNGYQTAGSRKKKRAGKPPAPKKKQQANRKPPENRRPNGQPETFPAKGKSPVKGKPPENRKSPETWRPPENWKPEALPAKPKEVKNGRKPSIPAVLAKRLFSCLVPRHWKHRIPWMWDAPFTCWSNGHCVRVWVGEKVLHLSGKPNGRTFLVPVKNLHHWGIGSGPLLSTREQTELIHLIQEKTAPSPYLRVVFV